MNFDLLGVAIGAILTLLVFSYLIHDTFLFRLAQAVFVGVAIGYGATLIIHTVILNGIVQPFLDELTPSLFAGVAAFEPTALIRLAGLILIALVCFAFVVFNIYKGGEFARVAGNIPLGYLFGVGAALALVGALTGTLVPQFNAAIDPRIFTSGNALDLVNGIILLIGTVGALLAFRFVVGLKAQPLRAYESVARRWGQIGRGFIFTALGALFASVLIARVSVLIAQIYFLLNDFPNAVSQLFK